MVPAVAAARWSSAGAGKMGAWFSQFLQSQGFTVQVADPAGSAPGVPVVADWRALPDLDVFDFIVVATPLGASGIILNELALRRPAGVVFDLGSLKSPLRGGLHALKAAGVKVTSLHPMFGPSTELLSGRHVIFIDLGSAEALAAGARAVRAHHGEQVVMSLDEHDRLVAYVLGLSHALNIAFFTALAESGEAAPKLARMSSTTFDAQLDVATNVSEESPELYYEIQALNDYGAESLQALSQSVERLRTAVLTRDFTPDGAGPGLSQGPPRTGCAPGLKGSMSDVIDRDGFRANVGIVLMDDTGQLFLGRRTGGKGWQFPQGGMRAGRIARRIPVPRAA